MNYEEPEYDESPSQDAEAGTMTISPVEIKYDAQKVYDSIVRTASHTIVESAGREIKKDVHSAVAATINEKVSALIDASLETGIQPMNSYGEPLGERTTLKAMIGKAGEKYLTEKVDKEGRASSYQQVGTRLEYLVEQAIAKHINYQLQTEIKKAVELATAQATAKVGEVVGSLIVKLGK